MKSPAWETAATETGTGVKKEPQGRSAAMHCGGDERGRNSFCQVWGDGHINTGAAGQINAGAA